MLAKGAGARIAKYSLCFSFVVEEEFVQLRPCERVACSATKINNARYIWAIVVLVTRVRFLLYDGENNASRIRLEIVKRVLLKRVKPS